MTASHPHIHIRPATGDDARILDSLAQLDSADPLTGPALLGIVDGVVLAAVEIDSGRAVADPFAPTADLVALLTLRARRLATPQTRTRRARVAARRLAHAAG